jgi:hypothetical protein
MSDIVRVKLEDGSEVSVGRSFAESHGLEPLDKPAVDNRGKALAAKPYVDISLRGKELDEALTAAGLSTTGKLADKQARLSEHESNTVGAGVVADPNAGGNVDPNGGELS